MSPVENNMVVKQNSEKRNNYVVMGNFYSAIQLFIGSHDEGHVSECEWDATSEVMCTFPLLLIYFTLLIDYFFPVFHGFQSPKGSYSF